MQETTDFNTFLGACNLNLISSEISILHIILINNKKYQKKKWSQKIERWRKRRIDYGGETI